MNLRHTQIALATNADMPGAMYTPPSDIGTLTVTDLLGGVRSVPPHKQERLGLRGVDAPKSEPEKSIYYAGDLSLVHKKCVAIVGSRKVSPEGASRARKLARGLVAADVVVVSGLALGIDVNAHRAAIEAGGRTIAVIGTPLNQAYPAAHGALQERIWREHLLVSPFSVGSKVYPSSFPIRNRYMAALADATVIIEASDTSGTLHQAAECVSLRRPLFIAKSVVEDQRLTWPARFTSYPTVQVLESIDDVLAAL